MERVADQCRVTVEVVLCGILKRGVLFSAFHSVCAGYAVADELNLSLRQWWRLENPALMLAYEAPGFGMGREAVHCVGYCDRVPASL